MISGLDIGIGKTISFSDLDHMGLEDIYYSRLSPEGKFLVFTLEN